MAILQKKLEECFPKYSLVPQGYPPIPKAPVKNPAVPSIVSDPLVRGSGGINQWLQCRLQTPLIECVVFLYRKKPPSR